MKFTLQITISLKEGMLDPEATAIQHALKNIGFPTDLVRSARTFAITFEAPDEVTARATGAKMCERLLANPVIHNYRIEVSR
jgi:phosphoribosylformylglycinamidine synthase